jgi:hypothetical protein
MEMTPVIGSSHIEASGYDPETCTMRVRFKGGRVYESGNVSPEAYEAFSNAESAGKHWHTAFRGNPDYKFTPISVDGEE